MPRQDKRCGCATSGHKALPAFQAFCPSGASTLLMKKPAPEGAGWVNPSAQALGVSRSSIESLSTLTSAKSHVER